MSDCTELSRKIFAHSATWMCFNTLQKPSLLYLRDFESSVSHCLGPSDSDTLRSISECPTFEKPQAYPQTTWTDCRR